MKRVLIAALGLVLLLVAAVICAVLLVNPDRFRPQLQTTLSESLGRPVSLGKLHVAMLEGSLQADDVRIADDPAFGTEPFVSAKSLSLGVRLWPLLMHQQVRITSLTLDQPRVELQQNAAGVWNFASLGAATSGASAQVEVTGAGNLAPKPEFSVDKLRIRDGRVDLRRMAGVTRSYSAVQLSAENVGTGASFPLSMSAVLAGGGTLQVDGAVGPWSAGDAIRTPLNLHLVLHGLDLVADGLTSHGDGVGGVLDIDTMLEAGKGLLTARGEIQAHKLQLVAAGSPAPQLVTIAYQAEYRLDKGHGLFKQTTLGSGRAKLALQGSFDNRPKVMQLNLQLSGKQLPVDDLQPLLPAFGVVLPKDSRLSGGQISVDLALRGPLDALVISGPVTLDNSRLLGFSLGSHMGSVLSLAGIHAPRDTVITHAEATLKMDPAGLAAKPFSATVADLGEVSGIGSMTTSGALDARMLVKLDASLSGSSQSGLAGLLGGSQAGRLLGGVMGSVSSHGIGVRVSGTASAPKFTVDPAAAAGLIESGLSGGRASRQSRQPRQPAQRDAIKDLLRGVLH